MNSSLAGCKYAAWLSLLARLFTCITLLTLLGSLTLVVIIYIHTRAPVFCLTDATCICPKNAVIQRNTASAISEKTAVDVGCAR